MFDKSGYPYGDINETTLLQQKQSFTRAHDGTDDFFKEWILWSLLGQIQPQLLRVYTITDLKTDVNP